MHRRHLEICVAAVALAGISESLAQAVVKPLATEFPISHSDPEASVPSAAARNAKPLEFGYFIQDLVAFATAAGKSGDHIAEARYYRAFAKAVPDEIVAFSKLCKALEAAGERDQAKQACRDALGRPGVELEDYQRFVHLVLANPGEITKVDAEDVRQVIDHLQSNPATHIAGTHLECEFALHIRNVALLERCTAALASVAPGDPKTISFSWALALEKGDRTGAEHLIERAQSVGISAGGIERMRQATLARLAPWSRRLVNRPGVWAGLLIVAGIAALWIMRRRRDLRNPIG